MEEGDGIGFDPVCGARQQQAEQPRVVELVEQLWRQPPRLLDLVCGRGDRGTQRFGAGNHHLVARKFGSGCDHHGQL